MAHKISNTALEFRERILLHFCIFPHFPRREVAVVIFTLLVMQTMTKDPPTTSSDSEFRESVTDINNILAIVLQNHTTKLPELTEASQAQTVALADDEGSGRLLHLPCTNRTLYMEGQCHRAGTICATHRSSALAFP